MSEKETDIKLNAADALEFEPLPVRPSKLGQRLKTFFLVILSGATGALFWEYFGEKVTLVFDQSNSEVPLIRAELGEVKTRPQNPGGIKVPNQKVFVYDDIHATAGGQPRLKPVERLLPPPEKPLPKEFGKAPPQPKTLKHQVNSGKISKNIDPLSNIPSMTEVESAKRPINPPLVPELSNSLSSNKETLKNAKKLPDDVIVKNIDKNDTKTKIRSTQNISKINSAKNKNTQNEFADSGYRVQLAASRSIRATRKVWTKLRKQNLDLLGNFDMTVTKVDLGKKKGIFYRLRVGPFPKKNKARKLCKALKKRKLGCLVIRPSE